MMYYNKKELFKRQGVFFNYAATAPVLEPSLKCIQGHIKQFQEPLSHHFEEWFSLLETARKCLASFIMAKPSELCFVQGTSVGLSIIANSISWEKGDEILIPANEFPSNRVVWQALEKRHVFCRVVPFDPDKTFYQQIQELDLSRVRLISFSLISYLDGYVENAEAIISLAKEKNCLTMIDAIQAIGVIPVDVKKLNCDFLVCGGQKWLFGPVGSGFLYIKKESFASLIPSYVGWCSIKNPFDYFDTPLVLEDSARCFEPSLPNVPYIQGLRKSVEYLENIGLENIYKQIQLNRQAVQEICYPLKPYLERSIHQNSGILTYQCENKRLAEGFYKDRIVSTFRENYLRLSMHYFTTNQELNILRDCINNVFKPRKRLLKLEGSSKKISPKNNTALITGASSGLGLAIAKQLAAKNIDLFLIGRNENKLKKEKERLEATYSVTVSYASIDLSNTFELDKFLRETDLKHIKYIINNAAYATTSAFECIDDNEMEKIFKVNCYSAFKLVKTILPNMIASKSGYILNIVTSGARMAFPLFSMYSATKSALWTWSEGLSRELSTSGIGVTAFLPPHMPSNLYYSLARSSLSHYQLKKAPSKNNINIDTIAQKAVSAMFNKKSIEIPIKVKWKLFINLFFTKLIDKQIVRRFKY